MMIADFALDSFLSPDFYRSFNHCHISVHRNIFGFELHIIKV